METWQAIIKERNYDTLLTPSYTFASGSGFECIQDEREREYEIRKFLVDFWGLNKEDVEWYKLEKETKKVNEVTAFMYYICNQWGIDEAKKVFGDNLGEHIYKKFEEHQNVLGALHWYAGLDEECRQKLVDRANEIYNK